MTMHPGGGDGIEVPGLTYVGGGGENVSTHAPPLIIHCESFDPEVVAFTQCTQAAGGGATAGGTLGDVIVTINGATGPLSAFADDVDYVWAHGFWSCVTGAATEGCAASGPGCGPAAAVSAEGHLEASALAITYGPSDTTAISSTGGGSMTIDPPVYVVDPPADDAIFLVPFADAIGLTFYAFAATYGGGSDAAAAIGVSAYRLTAPPPPEDGSGSVIVGATASGVVRRYPSDQL